MRRRFIMLASALVAEGCAFHGEVKPTPYTDPAVFPQAKIVASVAYSKRVSKLPPMFVEFQGQSYEIKIDKALDSAVSGMLHTTFEKVSSDASDDTDLLMVPEFTLETEYLNGWGDGRFNATLKVEAIDPKTRISIKRYATRSNIAYSLPTSAVAWNVLTGLSLFVLSPLTIPMAVQAAGNEAVDVASSAIPDLVESIHQKMLADRALLVRRERPESVRIGKAAAAPSKYDQALNSVLVVRNSKGFGSGFYVNGDGLAVTNAHVVGKDGRVSVLTRAGETSWAEVVAVDEKRDLALLKTGITNTPWLCVAAQEELSIGSEVVAVGTPEGLDWSVSKGIISAVRSLNDVAVIQTDAAVNHGSSGGPVVSATTGHVVGVTSFALHRDVAGGLGFAISGQEINEAFPRALKRCSSPRDAAQL